MLTAGGGAIKDGITLPKKAVEQVDGLLRNADGDVALWSGDNLLRLNVGSVSMTARLNQGGFPDYRRVIPEALENRLRINRQALLQAIDRLSAVTDPKSRGITFQIGGDTLVLSAGNPATGLGREAVGAEYAGKALAIGFNSDYVTACCRVIPDQELVLEFDSPKHAAIIRGATSEETVHVIMPLNVSARSHAALLEEVGAGSDVGMRFTQGRNTLLAPLAHMHGVVERVGTRPILSHVLIRAEAGSVVFDAGDNQVLYESERLTAEVDVAGAATVEAPLFYSVVGKLAEGDDVRVSLAAGGGGTGDGAWLVVEAGQSKFILPSLSTDDFPTLHDLEWEQGFELPVSDFRGLLNWCRISMSDDPARMHLNGVFLHAVEEGGQHLLRAGATDGHRLSQAECQCPDGTRSVGGRGDAAAQGRRAGRAAAGGRGRRRPGGHGERLDAARSRRRGGRHPAPREQVSGLSAGDPDGLQQHASGQLRDPAAGHRAPRARGGQEEPRDPLRAERGKPHGQRR